MPESQKRLDVYKRQAVICGLLVSPICYFCVKLIKGKLNIDDALDAFGCHGIGGIWGGIATGLFGMTSINGVAKWNGLVFGETRLFVAQIIGILAVSYTHLDVYKRQT